MAWLFFYLIGPAFCAVLFTRVTYLRWTGPILAGGMFTIILVKMGHSLYLFVPLVVSVAVGAWLVTRMIPKK